MRGFGFCLRELGARADVDHAQPQPRALDTRVDGPTCQRGVSTAITIRRFSPRPRSAPLRTAPAGRSFPRRRAEGKGEPCRGGAPSHPAYPRPRTPTSSPGPTAGAPRLFLSLCRETSPRPPPPPPRRTALAPTPPPLPRVRGPRYGPPLSHPSHKDDIFAAYCWAFWAHGVIWRIRTERRPCPGRIDVASSCWDCRYEWLGRGILGFGRSIST
jgi:hypothetical protein